MSRILRIARDLILPLEAATQTFLIVGKRGSGKTSTAVRLAEQFYRAKVPFAVVDPVDVWWGLKSSRKGGQGLGVYVFWGRHGDLPDIVRARGRQEHPPASGYRGCGDREAGLLLRHHSVGVTQSSEKGWCAVGGERAGHQVGCLRKVGRARRVRSGDPRV